MSQAATVLEYKCPCCDAGLKFGENVQKMTCAYCGNEFDLETVREYNEALTENADDFQWDGSDTASWSEEEQETLQSFSCPACGGELTTDGETVATFCPFCDNPAILPTRVSGGLKPDGVIPFQMSKEDAQSAFARLCKGKLLLPKDYAAKNRIEKITGIYVPFWLYDCSADQQTRFRATRLHHWSDSKYNYTRTDYFLLNRSAKADFSGIPMDGSSKLDDAIMESIEPFDYARLVDFERAYLSGFFADKYNVPAEDGRERVCQRAGSTLESRIAESVVGFASAVPVNSQRSIHHGKAKYVLLPVWMLYTKYNGQTYVFAMNGQTGKMTGTFPICKKKSALWFTGICAAVALAVTVLQYWMM